MKLLSDTYPLLGCDLTQKGNFEEVYELAEKIVDVVVKEKKSYAEACRAFDIAKDGLAAKPLRD